MSENGDRPELPKGWEWSTVGNVTIECRRGRPPSYEGGTVTVVNQKCIRHGTAVDLQHAKKTNPTTKPIPEWAELREGDVLVNSTGTGTLGRVGWLRGDPDETITLDTHVTLVRPNQDVVFAEFLGWFLHSNESALIESATGSTNQKELHRKAIEAVPIPVPPLSEQRRIATRIERRFGLLNGARADLDLAAEALPVLQQRAVEELLMTRAGVLPDAWRWRCLAEIADLSAGGTPSRGRPEYYGGDIPWIKIGDLNEGTVVDAEETITQDGLDNSSADLLDPGAVLLAMYGASIGRTGVLGVRAATNQAICALRPKRDQIDLRYLHRLIQASKPALVAAGYGGAQPNISQKFLKKFQIPVPPLGRQAELLEQVDGLDIRMRSVREQVEESRQRDAQLRTAALHTEFAGNEDRR